MKGLQGLVQGCQVRLIGAAIRQADIQIAGLFAKREVFFAMQGQCEHGGVARKHMGRPIALVHIQINHRHFHVLAVVPTCLGLHQACGHGDVVEHTKAPALMRIGVVRAARQVAGHALQ